MAALVTLACLALYCELLYRFRASARSPGGVAWSVLLVGVAAVASVIWTLTVGWIGMRWIVAQIH
jgi:hypothetical protein